MDFLKKIACIVLFFTFRIYPAGTLLVIPYAQEGHAQKLVAQACKSFDGSGIDTMILLCQSHDSCLHGVGIQASAQTLAAKSSLILQQDLLSSSSLFYYYPLCSATLPMHTELLRLLPQITQSIALVVGSLSCLQADQIAAILGRHANARTVIVFSGNISDDHNCIYTCPIDQSVACAIYQDDAIKMQAIESNDYDKQLVLSHNGALQASLFSLLFAVLRLPQFQFHRSACIGYATSCDPSLTRYGLPFDHVHGCTQQQSVISSYGAFVFQQQTDSLYNPITAYEELQLLQIARYALYDLFAMPFLRVPSMVSYQMMQHHGLFVSLYGMSDHGIFLKGCVGKVVTGVPLCDMVYQMSQQAACKDVRYPPLQEQDVASAIIWLSLITDFGLVDDVTKIEPMDGLMLQYRKKIAITLPSSPVVEQWSYQSALHDVSLQIADDQFLWKNPACQLFRFRSFVFQEE